MQCSKSGSMKIVESAYQCRVSSSRSKGILAATTAKPEHSSALAESVAIFWKAHVSHVYTQQRKSQLD
jgi:hypothetical protein